MCTKMPNNIKEERLRWILPIQNKEAKLKEVAKLCPYSKRSLERWLGLYRKHGARGLIPKSTQPKTNPQETPIRVKERVLELRKETKLCALKLHWKLKKEDIRLHPRTIGKIIKKEGLVRKYRVRRIKYQYLKAKLKPGELVEIDIKYVPGRLNRKRYYQFTAIDCASRWRYLRIYPDFSNYSVMLFVQKLLKVAPFKIQAIKTDNGPSFTNRHTGYLKSTDTHNPRLHPLDVWCEKKGINHFLIDPGKPQQNGKVERSHRSDQEHFYDRIKFTTENELKLKIRLWNMYYNDLEHCGLSGQTPNQMLNFN